MIKHNLLIMLMFRIWKEKEFQRKEIFQKSNNGKRLIFPLGLTSWDCKFLILKQYKLLAHQEI